MKFQTSTSWQVLQGTPGPSYGVSGYLRTVTTHRPATGNRSPAEVVPARPQHSLRQKILTRPVAISFLSRLWKMHKHAPPWDARPVEWPRLTTRPLTMEPQSSAPHLLSNRIYLSCLSLSPPPPTSPHPPQRGSVSPTMTQSWLYPGLCHPPTNFHSQSLASIPRQTLRHRRENDRLECPEPRPASVAPEATFSLNAPKPLPPRTSALTFGKRRAW